MISQQSIQLIADKIKSKPDPHQNRIIPNWSNPENLLLLAQYYGSNYQVMQKEFKRNMKPHDQPNSNLHNWIISHNNMNHQDLKSHYNHLINLNKGRNVSIEEMNTQGRCQSNHSPLLIKRKYSRKRGGNSTTRNRYWHQNGVTYSHLTANLRSSSQKKEEERKSTEW